ncbi:MAG: hypothetical protein FWC41_07450 [Firmicutes bacterium]|nr:hypothetical protein [Bacillota bacterium]
MDNLCRNKEIERIEFFKELNTVPEISKEDRIFYERLLPEWMVFINNVSPDAVPPEELLDKEQLLRFKRIASIMLKEKLISEYYGNSSFLS